MWRIHLKENVYADNYMCVTKCQAVAGGSRYSVVKTCYEIYKCNDLFPN